jgi:hypothetical protein
MKHRLPIITILAMFIAFSTDSKGVTFTFQENGSNVDLGPTSTFIEGGFSLTASGFLTSGGTTHLYAKNSSSVRGSGEIGLGTTSDSSGQHEITTNDFIQLTLPTTPPSNVQLVLAASVQSGESALVYFTNTAGTLTGATLVGTLTNADGSISIPPGDQTGFIDITAGQGNVLLSGVIATPISTPDGGATVALLGFALAGIALFQRIGPNSLQAK